MTTNTVERAEGRPAYREVVPGDRNLIHPFGPMAWPEGGRIYASVHDAATDGMAQAIGFLSPAERNLEGRTMTNHPQRRRLPARVRYGEYEAAFSDLGEARIFAEAATTRLGCGADIIIREGREVALTIEPSQEAS